MPRSPSTAVGLRLIVVYKLTKAAVELLIAATLVLAPQGGLAEHLRAIAELVKVHAAGAWSAVLAEQLVRATTPAHLELFAAVSALDGVFSAFEGWARHRRYAWAPWLIIVATSALLPFEIVELLRQVTVGRTVLFIANAAIVTHLVRRHVRRG